MRCYKYFHYWNYSNIDFDSLCRQKQNTQQRKLISNSLYWKYQQRLVVVVVIAEPLFVYVLLSNYGSDCHK
jgi:hypothetical protein